MKPSTVASWNRSRPETEAHGPSPNLGLGPGGRSVLAHWMAGGLRGGARHIHLGQGRQIERFVQR